MPSQPPTHDLSLSNAQIATGAAASVAFALSGLVTAARTRLDAVGVVVVAGLSAFGGSTLRHILLELHMHLAIEYLRKTDMSTEEIALRLDYSDAANFRRAFTRWTQRSPSHFRGR